MSSNQYEAAYSNISHQIDKIRKSVRIPEDFFSKLQKLTARLSVDLLTEKLVHASQILNCHQHHVLKALLSKMYIFRVQSLYFNLSSGLPNKVLGHLSSFFSEIKNWTPETSILTRVGSTPIFSPPEGTRRESPRDKQVPESSDSDKYFILYFFGGGSTDLSHRNCCNIYYAYR